jgi:hypothetical protein
LLKAKDLTNNEAVHMALALQTILLKVADGSWIVDDEDSPIDRWLSKTPCREQVELLDAYVQQAQIAGNFDLIIEHLKEAADRPNGLMAEDRFFGRFGVNSYFFEVPALRFNGDANSPLASNCSNLAPTGLVKVEVEQPNELQPKPKKMRLKQTKSKRQARLNPPIHNQYRGPPGQGRHRTRIRSVTPRRDDRVVPGTRTRNIQVIELTA